MKGNRITSRRTRGNTAHQSRQHNTDSFEVMLLFSFTDSFSGFPAGNASIGAYPAPTAAAAGISNRITRCGWGCQNFRKNEIFEIHVKYSMKFHKFMKVMDNCGWTLTFRNCKKLILSHFPWVSVRVAYSSPWKIWNISQPREISWIFDWNFISCQSSISFKTPWTRAVSDYFCFSRASSCAFDRSKNWNSQERERAFRSFSKSHKVS